MCETVNCRVELDDGTVVFEGAVGLSTLLATRTVGYHGVFDHALRCANQYPGELLIVRQDGVVVARLQLAEPSIASVGGGETCTTG